MGDGILNNDYVTTANISGVSYLNLSNNNTSGGLYITDLTGIEDFTLITFRNCAQNQLTSLDVNNEYCFDST